MYEGMQLADSSTVSLAMVIGLVVVLMLLVAFVMSIVAFATDPTGPGRDTSWEGNVTMSGTLTSSNTISADQLVAGDSGIQSTGPVTVAELSATAVTATSVSSSGAVTAGSAGFSSTTGGLTVAGDIRSTAGSISAANMISWPTVTLLNSGDGTLAANTVWGNPTGTAGDADGRIAIFDIDNTPPLIKSTYAQYTGATATANTNLYAALASSGTLANTGGYILLRKAGQWQVSWNATIRGNPSDIPTMRMALLLFNSTASPDLRAILQSQPQGSQLLTSPMFCAAKLLEGAGTLPSATTVASGMITQTINTVTAFVCIAPIIIRTGDGITGTMTYEVPGPLAGGNWLGSNSLQLSYLGPPQ